MTTRRSAASKRGKANRRKGQEYELQVIKLLRARLPGWTISDRGFQARGGQGTADVEATRAGLRLHIECKTGGAPGLLEAWRQADGDCNPHMIPIGLCHWTRGPTLVVMENYELRDICKEAGLSPEMVLCRAWSEGKAPRLRAAFERAQRATLAQARRVRTSGCAAVGVCNYTTGPTLACMDLDGLLGLLGKIGGGDGTP